MHSCPLQAKAQALAAKDRKLQELSLRPPTGAAPANSAGRAQVRGPGTTGRRSARDQNAAVAALEQDLSDARKRVAHLRGRDSVLTDTVRRLQQEKQSAVDTAEETRAALAGQQEGSATLQRKLTGLQKAVDKVR
jgi:TolA-binding protein